MIATILGSAAHFPAVSYNTDKIGRDLGELMLVGNFGPLQGLDQLRPEDYVNYFQMLAGLNKNVAGPQFHAAISTEGKRHDKHELTAIAVQWLKEMGYADQPFLVVFHKDTDNHHVHVVSVRIDRDGKKIPSGFEHNRAVQSINKVMGLNEKYSAEQDIAKALDYSFSTKAQFLMILEAQGYVVREKAGQLEVIKFGKKQAELPIVQVTEKLGTYQADKKRQAQLKAILHKYGRVYDTTPKPQTTPLPGGFNKSTGKYTSELAAYLKETMGASLVFHAGEGKAPYGYSLIDHTGTTVWKGSELVALKELLAMDGRETFEVKKEPEIYAPKMKSEPFVANETAADPVLQETFLEDSRHPAGDGFDFDEYLFRDPVPAYAEEAKHNEPHRAPAYIPPVSIADDVDDQQIHGPRRKRQKKARTNTR